MTTYKRVDGDYHIVTVNPTDTVYIDSDNVEMSGNITIQDLSISNVNATGNVSADGFFIGDGRYLSNVVANIGGASLILNGTTQMSIPVPNGNILVDINGTSNVFTFTVDEFTAPKTVSPTIVTNQIGSDDSSFVIVDDGMIVQGELEVTGNIGADYFIGNGSQLSGIDAGSISNGTSEMFVVSSGGNIDGNIAGSTVMNLASTGLKITGSIEATGGFVGLDATKIENGTSHVEVLASGGNIEANVGGSTVALVTDQGVEITGNLSVTGNASLSGNILGDRVQNGTTSIDIQTPNGNANITVGGVSNVAVFTTSGLDITGAIESSTTVTATGNVIGGNLTTAGVVAATGNVTGGNLTTAGVISINANDAATAIENSGTDGIGNIGASGAAFNTIFAKATSAQYADLAEKYLADQEYLPGTVLEFGGDAEVTICKTANSHRVAGVVSTQPAYIMNSTLNGNHVCNLALIGRVPCLVRGPVEKGDILVSDIDGYARVNNNAEPGRIIGKSLQTSQHDNTIEVVVGKH